MLHHGANSLPRWFLECIGLYVCLMDRCGYCVSHHCQGMLRLIGDDARAESIRRDLERGNVTDGFNERQAAALRYAEVLTRSPADVAESHIQVMRTQVTVMERSWRSTKLPVTSPTPTAWSWA